MRAVRIHIKTSLDDIPVTVIRKGDFIDIVNPNKTVAIQIQHNGDELLIVTPNAKEFRKGFEDKLDTEMTVTVRRENE